MDLIFKGKSKIDEKWYEGYYFVKDDALKNKPRHLIVRDNKGGGPVTIDEPVYGHTVGVYTGLEIDGTKVFTKDILTSDGIDYEIIYSDHVLGFLMVNTIEVTSSIAVNFNTIKPLTEARILNMEFKERY